MRVSKSFFDTLILYELVFLFAFIIVQPFAEYNLLAKVDALLSQQNSLIRRLLHAANAE